MTLEEIIKRIGIIRSRAKLSARTLSFAIDKSEPYISTLETKRNFEPSLMTLMKIIEACGSTPEEFFYYDIYQYKKDCQLIDYIKDLSPNQKDAVLCLYKK
ncbi:MAG: helix-turn-helix domain-containing protein [Firmicutes bacterium]|nr:helix-turn-helix domain-containing protein [Bacillota bacterium]